MDYEKGLKALRAKMIEKSTGRSLPVSSSIESFIPSRGAAAPQETTEDLLTKGATWLSEIKKASVEYKKAYEAAKPKERENTAEKIAEKVAVAIIPERSPEAEARTKGFIERRSSSRPSTYAPDINYTPPGYGNINKGQMESIIREEAVARGIDPEVAVAIFHSEGAGAYQSQIARSGNGALGGKEASFGPFQLYTGGGLGNVYEEQTGRRLTEDNTLDGITTQIRFALDQAVTNGWTPWYGRKHAGVGERDGLQGARQLGNWKT